MVLVLLPVCGTKSTDDETQKWRRRTGAPILRPARFEMRTVQSPLSRIMWCHLSWVRLIHWNSSWDLPVYISSRKMMSCWRRTSTANLPAAKTAEERRPTKQNEPSVPGASVHVSFYPNLT